MAIYISALLLSTGHTPGGRPLRKINNLANKYKQSPTVKIKKLWLKSQIHDFFPFTKTSPYFTYNN